MYQQSNHIVILKKYFAFYKMVVDWRGVGSRLATVTTFTDVSRMVNIFCCTGPVRSTSLPSYAERWIRHFHALAKDWPVRVTTRALFWLFLTITVPTTNLQIFIHHHHHHHTLCFPFRIQHQIHIMTPYIAHWSQHCAQQQHATSNCLQSCSSDFVFIVQ